MKVLGLNGLNLDCISLLKDLCCSSAILKTAAFLFYFVFIFDFHFHF